MKKATYYIGANNITNLLEVEKIETVCNRFFEGYTALEVIGYWKGNRERTLRIEVVCDLTPVELTRVAKELAKELQQDAVMLEITESNTAFVTA
jgi:hypothetical protein